MNNYATLLTKILEYRKQQYTCNLWRLQSLPFLLILEIKFRLGGPRSIPKNKQKHLKRLSTLVCKKKFLHADNDDVTYDDVINADDADSAVNSTAYK